MHQSESQLSNGPGERFQLLPPLVMPPGLPAVPLRMLDCRREGGPASCCGLSTRVTVLAEETEALCGDGGVDGGVSSALGRRAHLPAPPPPSSFAPGYEKSAFSFILSIKIPPIYELRQGGASRLCASEQSACSLRTKLRVR